jgi:hypothetical protein
MQKLKDAMVKGLRKSLAIDDVEAMMQAQLERRQRQLIRQANSQISTPISAQSNNTSNPQPTTGYSNVRSMPQRDLARSY